MKKAKPKKQASPWGVRLKPQEIAFLKRWGRKPGEQLHRDLEQFAIILNLIESQPELQLVNLKPLLGNNILI